jgi:SAM-dependent methyltransferase
MKKYVVYPGSRLYQKAILREFSVWEKASKNFDNELVLEENESKLGENHPVINAYNQSILQSSSWYQYLMDNVKGPFSKGLSLGTGSGFVENIFVERKYVKSFDKIDIIFSKRKSNDKHTLEINQNDLNFISLPENHYDIILAQGILHHIINLEHLILEVNNSLTPNGIFVIFEYIGENKQQWKDNKIKVINENLMKEFPDWYDFLKVERPKMTNISPFESIRSEDILPLVDSIFPDRLFKFKWNGIVYTMLNNICAKLRLTKNNNINISRELIRSVLESSIKLEKEIMYCNTSGIIDCALFIACLKTSSVPKLEVKPWSNLKIKKEFTIHLSFLLRIRILLSRIKILKIIYHLVK